MISIDFVIGLIVTAVLLVAGVVGNRFGVRLLARGREEGGFDGEEKRTFGRILSWGGGLVVVAATLIAAWGFYPYDMQYHRYTHVQGTVASVQSRLLGDGKSTTQNYAVRLREDGQTYRCDDTRCSLLHEGDRVALWCIREWQYASTSGWDCNFDATGPARPS